MSNREWLYRGFKLQTEIEELTLALKNAQDEAIYISPQMGDKVQNSSGNTVENKYLKINGYLEKIKTLVLEKQKIMLEILTAIENVPDNRLRNVMIARYVNCKSIEVIAVENAYAYRWVCHLLRRGEGLINRTYKQGEGGK